MLSCCRRLRHPEGAALPEWRCSTAPLTGPIGYSIPGSVRGYSAMLHWRFRKSSARYSARSSESALFTRTYQSAVASRSPRLSYSPEPALLAKKMAMISGVGLPEFDS